jgi:cytoskeletal protein RodZ
VPESDWAASIDKETVGDGVSIGDALAEGRRQAGLTVTQVSQRTCIRETIIRSIERGDFTGCGGDFYARGHIRSIANAVGLNPEPLIAEYDQTMGAPQVISAADVFQPVTPVKLKERRRLNWTMMLLSVLVLAVGGFLLYHHSSHSSRPTAAKQDAKQNPATGDTGSPASSPGVSASPAVHKTSHRLDIRLKATQNCWVQLTRSNGRTIFAGTVYAGSTMTWTEHHAVQMTLGNPSGVKVFVNGKSSVPRGTVSMITLSLHAGTAH